MQTLELAAKRHAIMYRSVCNGLPCGGPQLGPRGAAPCVVCPPQQAWGTANRPAHAVGQHRDQQSRFAWLQPLFPTSTPVLGDNTQMRVGSPLHFRTSLDWADSRHRHGSCTDMRITASIHAWASYICPRTIHDSAVRLRLTVLRSGRLNPIVVAVVRTWLSTNWMHLA